MGKRADSYSIRQMMDLTGLSEFTLRGWENRYKAFKPRRSSTGRRSYAQSDVEKALLLRELTLRDFRIGDIADLSPEELERLLEKKAIAPQPLATPFRGDIEKILKNLSLQNWDALAADIRTKIQETAPKVALTDLVVPLIKELGEMVSSGVISISQEHIFSAILKEQLYILRNRAPQSHPHIRFVVASPEGDFHELGILIAHTMMAHSGLKSLYLGPNTPKKDLCETALRFGATHLLIASTVSKKEGAREDLYSFLHFIDQHLAQDIEVWLGGRNAIRVPTEFKRKLVHFPSLLDFEKAIDRVESK